MTEFNINQFTGKYYIIRVLYENIKNKTKNILNIPFIFFFRNKTSSDPEMLLKI